MAAVQQWPSVVAAADAAIPGASAIDAPIGRSLRDKLNFVGQEWTRNGSPTGTLVESPAHVTWRTVTEPAVIADLDQLSKLADGLNTPSATIAAAQTRLKAAASKPGLAAGRAALLAEASRYPVPSEPPFYVDDYYAAGRKSSYFSEYTNRGELERALVDAIAAVEAWLLVV